jgi:hypothetical protein
MIILYMLMFRVELTHTRRFAMHMLKYLLLDLHGGPISAHAHGHRVFSHVNFPLYAGCTIVRAFEMPRSSCWHLPAAALLLLYIGSVAHGQVLAGEQLTPARDFIMTTASPLVPAPCWGGQRELEPPDCKQWILQTHVSAAVIWMQGIFWVAVLASFVF